MGDLKRIAAYSVLAFVLGLFGSYFFQKKIIGRPVIIDEWTEIPAPPEDPDGLMITEKWLENFGPTKQAGILGLESDKYDMVTFDPGENYLYYTKCVPAPRNFEEVPVKADNNVSFLLCRASLAKPNAPTDLLVHLGFVRDPLTKPHFVNDKLIFLQRRVKDSDGDGEISKYDNLTIWSCKPNGEELKMLYALPENCKFAGSDFGGERLLITNESEETYFWNIKEGKKEILFEGRSLAFAFQGEDAKGKRNDQFLTLKEEEGGVKSFERCYRPKASEKPIFAKLSLPPEEFTGANLRIVDVRDYKNGLIYFQGQKPDKDGNLLRGIWSAPLTKKTSLERVTPLEFGELHFFRISLNKHLLLIGGEGDSMGLFCIKPSSDQPVQLFKYGENVLGRDLSAKGKYFAYVKYSDTNGDGFTDILKEDRSNIFIVKIQGE